MAADPVFYFPITTPPNNNQVKLVAFDIDLHSTAFVGRTHAHPELFQYLPSGYFESVDQFKHMLRAPESVIALSNPQSFLFAIIDLTKPPSAEDEEGELAGIIAFIHASEANRSAEIGPIVVLPAYQHTHVTTHAMGLLLRYAYSPPLEGGLGLARLEYKCHAANIASTRIAERMGFAKVGVIPYHMKLPRGRQAGKVGNGKPLMPGDGPDDVWRDTVLYSLSWDLWEAQARMTVADAMARY